jgi:hypothetical protein
MAKMGRNVKVTVERKHREAMRKILSDVLGATRVASDEAKDIYRLDDGNFGVFFAADGEALTPEQARRGAWLELLVADPASLRGDLSRLGAELVDYTDKSHDYWALPGGQVVRLAGLDQT